MQGDEKNPGEEPLIDPRRGDVDDDTSSTTQKSTLWLAGRFLTEISFAKLALSILVTLVIPALLIGIAPLLVTAWFESFSSIATGFLTFALLLTGLATLIAWTVGWRVFVQSLEQNFWSLNAVAVQPAYIFLREWLRFLGDRWPGLAPDHLRRGSAVAAGLLLSGSGLAIAGLAWPGTRWIGTVWDLAAVWPLFFPTLANGIFLTGGYLAVAVLFWAFADVRTDQTIDALIFKPVPERRRAWRVAHLSDVHVVGERFGFRIESGRNGPQGNGRFALVMRKLEDIHAAHPLDLILISGDMTDSGLSSEWAEFMDVVARHPRLQDIMLVLPGNHDVNIVDRANPARIDLPFSPGKRLRQLRCLSAIADIQGDRVQVGDLPRDVPLQSLNDALDPFRQRIRLFADTGRLRLSLPLAQVWENCFPMILPPQAGRGLGVVLLNSNAEAHFSFTNALGLLSERQIDKMIAAMERYPDALWIIALHHHLVEYPMRRAAFSERAGTALINGSWFLRRLRRVSSRAVALHGHRHIDWMGSCGGLKIISAPSPVMEARNPEATGFYIHTLWADSEGVCQVAKPARVVLEGQDHAPPV
ncbi:MAG: metallophosphoesterase family protein [Beijerinckiaceae bacterium]